MSNRGGSGPENASAADFRLAARQFATGVTVATARDGDVVHGITATAFCPLSLDPPLVLLALDNAGRLVGMVRRSGTVGVSVLERSQQWIGEWGATHGREPGVILPGIDVETAVSGAPLIRDAVAWFDCVVESEAVHGDHALLVGRVVATSAQPGLDPLLYLRGAYHEVGAARPRSVRT